MTGRPASRPVSRFGPAAGPRGGTGAPPRWSRRLALASRPEVIGECRGFVRDTLGDWPDCQGCQDRPGGRVPSPPDGSVYLDDIVLLVSELVTNACRHGGGPRGLLLVRGPGTLRAEIADASPVPPRPRPPHGPGEPGGIGLGLVGRLAWHWGWRPCGDGKVVWFEVRAPGRAGSSSRAGLRPGRAARPARSGRRSPG